MISVRELIKRMNNKMRETVFPQVIVETELAINYSLICEDCMDKGVVCFDKFENKEELIIYSAGIANQINYELDLLERLNKKRVQLYAFDPTPKALEFLYKQKLPDNFHVMPYAISDEDKKIQFALPTQEGWMSGSAERVKNDERKMDFKNTIQVEGRSLKSIMKELGHDRIDLLKMDIEGSEFSALSSAFADNLKIEQICLDYHEYMFRRGRSMLKHFIIQLHNSGYRVYYSEPNGRCVGLIKV